MCNYFMCPICCGGSHKCVVCSRRFNPGPPFWDRCQPCAEASKDAKSLRERQLERRAAKVGRGTSIPIRSVDEDDA